MRESSPELMAPSVVLTEIEQGIPVAEDMESNGLNDHCGLMAIWDPANTHILEDANTGALNVQHRGEGGAGIAVVCESDDRIHLLRGAGKVAEVFGEDGSGMKLVMPADTIAAMVHTRWPTDKAQGDCNQPRFAGPKELAPHGDEPRYTGPLALAHNGNLINTSKLAKSFGVAEEEYTNDTDLCTVIIAKVAAHYDGDVEKAVKYVAPHLEGAFNIIILTKDKMIAIRDRNGMRPFQVGTTETGGVIVASENMAIDNVPGARWEREIEPAEMLVVDAEGPPRSTLWAKQEPAPCLMEYLYLSNKGTMLNGLQIGKTRRDIGAQVVHRIPPEILSKIAGFIPVPNGANQVTHGLSEATKIPYLPLLILNPAIKYGRSFIQPNQEAQFTMADGKHVVDPAVAPLVKGEEVAEVDDTQVRSNTQRAVVPKVRSAGPTKVHVIIPAPQYVGTCNLGVDTPDESELISVRHGRDTVKIAKEIGADTITYAELEDMYAVVGDAACTSCFGGKKPKFIQEAEAKKDEPAENLMPDLVAA